MITFRGEETDLVIIKVREKQKCQSFCHKDKQNPYFVLHVFRHRDGIKPLAGKYVTLNCNWSKVLLKTELPIKTLKRFKWGSWWCENTGKSIQILSWSNNTCTEKATAKYKWTNKNLVQLLGPDWLTFRELIRYWFALVKAANKKQIYRDLL